MPFLPLVGLGLLALGVFKALTDSSEHAEGEKSSDDGAKPATDGESEDDDEDDEDDDEQLDDEPYSDACDDDTDDTDSDDDDSDNDAADETEIAASDEHADAVEPKVADADQ